MEHMRRIAYETVLRACGFGALAIFCVMIGMSFHPKLAFQAGGFLTMIMAFILILKSREALTKDYRRTEMWLYIEKDFPPAGGLRAMGERDNLARHLPDLRVMDFADLDRDVGDRAHLHAAWNGADICP
jgi:hypothetical protein